MAKKRLTSKRGAKKSPKKPHWPMVTFKILSALAVLVVLVLGAGFLAKLLIDSPAETVRVAALPSRRPEVAPARTAKAPATHAPEKQVHAPEKPVYEVYSRSLPPETKPPVSMPSVPMPPMPGDQLPMAAIIIDDIGYDRRLANQFMDLGIPLTFSLLPHGPFSRTILSQAESKGLEFMLHLPMEPNEYPGVQPGPGALLTSMAPDELIAQLDKNIDYFSGIKGVNNHMGSRISASPEQMRQIFSILKKRGLFYVDSRTTNGTVARQSARLLQLPFAERDVFLDHEDDAVFIRSQLDLLVKRAQKQGYAIGIGHPHPNTYQVLRDMMPQLKQQVTIVPVSMIVQQVMFAQAARTSAEQY